MAESVLHVENVTMQFGGVVAVNNLSMDIYEGEIVALIGPNGAGKTTAFNCITGVYEPTNGKVEFCGKTIVENHPQGKMKKLYAGDSKELYPHVVSHTPDYITKMGIARTFQNIRLFKKMTVLENVKAAMLQLLPYSLPQAILRTGSYWSEEAAATEKAMDLLRVVHLDGKEALEADNLPYGQQRRLEIARALATDMKLLLLDEPAAGMNPTETEELLEIIDHIRKDYKVSVLLIEHDMSLVMNICERIQVLDFGTTIASGTPEQIANNEKVIEAYLGKDHTAQEVAKHA